MYQQQASPQQVYETAEAQLMAHNVARMSIELEVPHAHRQGCMLSGGQTRMHVVKSTDKDA